MRCLLFLLYLASLGMMPATPSLAQADQDLAKASQNPIGNLISLPFENNTSFDVGPEDAIVNTLNIKPVYPASVGSWTLINRGILPITYQGERFPGEGSEFGLGDFTYQGFFSPPASGKLMWGIGPALILPTATDDRLGTEKWSGGAALVALGTPGPWMVGALVSNVWSFAGDDDAADVDLFSLQYFVNFNFDSGWYLTSTPTMTADWNADSDERWTIPVGGGFGKLVRVGAMPLDMKLQGFWNVEKPSYAGDWTLQFQIKMLFPK